jgi:hypothetical protein
MYYVYSESGSAFSSPAVISFKTTGTTETLPWNPMFDGGLELMWDYNHIGVNPYGATFLATWGGDNRNNPNLGSSLIQSDLLQ